MKSILLFFVFTAGFCHAEPQKLFNGKDLTGWMEIPFTNGGKVRAIDGGIIECEIGNPLSGIVYTNTPPAMNYELTLEGMRVEGADFFIALTIPVEKNHCTVIIGGWCGSVCGVSSIDNLDAALNQWSQDVKLEKGIWYKLRVRVTPGVLQVFLNDKLYSARIEYNDSKRLTLRPRGEIHLTTPLGLATYYTKAHWRNFTLTPITKLKPADKLQKR
jgi:hypothetical protein